MTYHISNEELETLLAIEANQRPHRHPHPLRFSDDDVLLLCRKGLVVMSGVRVQITPRGSLALVNLREGRDVLHASAAGDLMCTLCPDEKRIITEVVKGESNAEIGLKHGLFPPAIAVYRHRLLMSLGVMDVHGRATVHAPFSA